MRLLSGQQSSEAACLCVEGGEEGPEAQPLRGGGAGRVTVTSVIAELCSGGWGGAEL